MFPNSQTQSIEPFNNIYYFMFNKCRILQQNIYLLFLMNISIYRFKHLQCIRSWIRGIHKDIVERKRGRIFFDT